MRFLLKGVEDNKKDASTLGFGPLLVFSENLFLWVIFVFIFFFCIRIKKNIGQRIAYPAGVSQTASLKLVFLFVKIRVYQKP